MNVEIGRIAEEVIEFTTDGACARVVKRSSVKVYEGMNELKCNHLLLHAD